MVKNILPKIIVTVAALLRRASCCTLVATEGRRYGDDATGTTLRDFRRMCATCYCLIHFPV
ncbi:hypothetical protein FJZ31_41795 [Candidatus Poribacteria bacterium]|nr:hypothetical protein [Candidatus Poribacteria bacterium]